MFEINAKRHKSKSSSQDQHIDIFTIYQESCYPSNFCIPCILTIVIIDILMIISRNNFMK